MLDYNRVFVGSACSNDCIYCPHAEKRNKPLDEVEADIFSGSGRHGIELYGGEPLDRFDFTRLVTSARLHSRRVKVVTNGRALSRWETAKSAADAAVTGFEIKIWGATPVIHDALTRRAGSLMEALQALSNARALPSKPFFALRVPVCKENLGQLSDIARIASALQADRLVMVPVDPGLSITRASEPIKLAIETAITNRVWAMTEGMPLCNMDGYETHVFEALLLPREERVKVTACAECAYGSACKGVSPNLAELFESEAKPVKESTLVGDLKAVINERQAKSPAYNV